MSQTTTPPSSSTLQDVTNMRLLTSRLGWWAIFDGRAALLPADAVDCGGARPVASEAALKQLRASGFLSLRPRRVFAVTVLTATSCNLGCAYCFQNTALPNPGSYAPPRIRAASITPEDVTAVARFVEWQMDKHGYTTSNLLLFGGEPLLNPSGAIALLKAFHKLGLGTAEIVTNGVLLTAPLAARLHEAGLKRVQITFDGSRASHDRIRVTRNGRATYDTILRNIADVTQRIDLAWNFRVNISHRNLDGLRDLIDDLGEITAGRHASLHLALIDDVGLGYDNQVDYSLTYAEQFAALNTYAIQLGFTIPVSRPLTECPYCSEPGGRIGAVINADGTLYSCWETTGRPEWSVGHITTGYDDTTYARRWVACDYDIKVHGTNDDAQAFFDHIDAATLDAMHEHRRLQPIPPPNVED